MSVSQLTPPQQRVLGCLLEKEVTVPASYPMTLNALRTACNQSSSREPVVNYDDKTVQDAARALKDAGLVRVTWMDYGKRTLKYAQNVVDLLALDSAERAVLTVLLLRGPQTLGELKSRTARLAEFSDRDEVAAVLEGLAGREHALVQRLTRAAGQQDYRWTHLLGELSATAVEAEVDREQLSGGDSAARDQALIVGYQALADADPEPESLRPFEEWFLTRLAELAGPYPLADTGSGLGDVTNILAEAGAGPTGFDLCPELVAAARLRYPGLSFETADFRQLLRPATAAGWGGVCSWFSLNHFTPREVAEALRHFTQIMLPGGALGLAVQCGNAITETTTWQGVELPVPSVLHDPQQIITATQRAGLVEVESYLFNGEMLYLLAKKTR